MGLRERIEQEVRAAIREARAHGGARVNVVSRVNKVVVRNVGEPGTTAEATAEQTAPIVQQPPASAE
ncbi:MAG: hypothetical protein QOF81_998 [Acidimicrobiaceae bacterium]|jgi:hypothetical protein|nr:hypothetical protein [Acidimicrobiaceae bacterium]MDQ1440597.1 hypothetical protein [Acidimicrobiaceae bacterium]